MNTDTTTSTPIWWEASRTPGMDAFGAPVKFTIDGKEAEAPAGASLLNALIANGVYVPHLCSHPELPPACRRGDGGGCNLCAVETSERPNKVAHSCKLEVSAGLAVRTTLPLIRIARQSALSKILANHPHVCLTCPKRLECDRTQCEFGHAPELRCCEKFDYCELRRIADYIGIRDNTPAYQYSALPMVKGDPFFERDYNLCIDCRRCLIACNDVRGVGCMEIKTLETPDGPRTYVGLKADNGMDAGCKYCQTCAAVCPTGAIFDRTLDLARRDETMVPCHAACPAGIDVPRYVQLAGEGKFAEAVAVVREKLPFPAILGRACFAPCESACRRGKLDDPLSIRSLKRISDDHDTGIWREHSKQLPPSGKRAAIIGSGPAGLTAAWYLAKKGHAVTIFDALPAAGGMVRYGIPSYRVPVEVLDRELGEVEKLGVKFEFGRKIEDLDPLFAQGFDAVFIGIGCQGGDRLGIPGDDLPGVIDSPTFLRAVSMGLVNKPGGPISTGAKVTVIDEDKVAVIGGGNVAADNARTSRRFGAAVDMVYRRTEAEMPIHHEELAGCVEEGVNVRYLLSPKRVELGDGRSKLSITYAKMQLGQPDASGRRRPIDTGEEITEGVDLVIAAVGQHVQKFAGYGIQVDNRGRIVVNAETLATSRSGVYAGGDCVLGPSTLIEAVAHGRRAAAAMDRQLGGDGDIEEKLLPDGWHTSPFLGCDTGFNHLHRLHPLK
ncbi:MAG TPA: FAD-dependent oxidoreductase, partial [Alphaproteobacteria bacterium]|nr:FAD-dependent oxidoreductase [Alphaproteobacteria bacterium]